MYMLSALAPRSAATIITVAAAALVIVALIGLFAWFILTDPDKEKNA